MQERNKHMGIYIQKNGTRFPIGGGYKGTGGTAGSYRTGPGI